MEDYGETATSATTSNNNLYLFYLNIINDLELIAIKADEFYDEQNLTKDKYYIQSLGNIDEVNNVCLFRNKTIVSETNITEDFRQKIKKYSQIQIKIFLVQGYLFL